MRKVNRTLLLLCFIVVFAQSQAQTVISLREALRLSKKQNPDLKVEAYNVDIAQADVTTSKIRYNPIFNIQTLHLASNSKRVEGTSWPNPQNNQYWYRLTKPFQVGVIFTPFLLTALYYWVEKKKVD